MADTTAIGGLNARVSALMHRVEYRRLVTSSDLEEVFKLRYDAYLREGAIAPGKLAALHDHFDTTANSTLFGIYVDERLAASIRIHVFSLTMPVSPAYSAFEDHLSDLISGGCTVVDPSRFVIEAEASRAYPELVYVVLRIPYLAGAYYQADYITATVRREHQAFYRRVLLCELVCQPRPYPTLLKPLSLMLAHYPNVEFPIAARYPFFSADKAELECVFKRARKLEGDQCAQHCCPASEVESNLDILSAISTRKVSCLSAYNDLIKSEECIG